MKKIFATMLMTLALCAALCGCANEGDKSGMDMILPDNAPQMTQQPSNSAMPELDDGIVKDKDGIIEDKDTDLSPSAAPSGSPAPSDMPNVPGSSNP